jgi:hypothetical protein
VDRFTLLDLMAIVAAFGVGFGLGAMLPGGPRSVKIAAGMVLGAILVPPAVLAARGISRGTGAPLLAGERIGMMPSLLLTLPILAAIDRGAFAMMLILAWIGSLMILGAVTGWLLLARIGEMGRTRITWLELYGYLLGLAMGGLAVWLLAAGLR